MRVRFYRYTVTGRVPFPTDMLRYDRCWPAEERPLPVHYVTEGAPHRITVLGIIPPAEPRWRSFSWEVGKVERVDASYPSQKDLHVMVTRAVALLEQGNHDGALAVLTGHRPKEES